MKSNSFWKQQWNSEVTASSVKATAQQQLLRSNGELDSFSYIHHSVPSFLKHQYLLDQEQTDNLWHLKD